MNTFRGLATGASYGALVAASSMVFGGLINAAYLLATGKAAEAGTVLAVWVVGAGSVAAIIGTMIGGFIGSLLGATGASRAASPLGCAVVLIITAAFINLAQDEEVIITYFFIPVVGLATALVAWWSGRRFAEVMAIPPAPAGAPIIAADLPVTAN